MLCGQRAARTAQRLTARTWRNVNLDGKYLQVQTIVKRLRSGVTEKDAKTTGSRRKVALTNAAVEALRAHRQRQREECLHAGDAWHDRDLVFCTQTGGYLISSNVDTAYKRLVARSGLPRIRFHDLRHTAATLMLLRGIHPKIVSEMLGHASVAITLSLYSHVLPDMQSAATAALDALLEG